MKLTVQKIILSLFSIAVSVAAAVIGMYMVFLANMVFGYRLLFAAIFMFNPILTIFLVVYMFKKPEPKEPKEKKKKKNEEDMSPAEPSYSAPASHVNSLPQTSQTEPSSTGYDLPGSETFTDYSDTMNASDVSNAEASANSVKNKLKFWANSDSDKEDNS